LGGADKEFYYSFVPGPGKVTVTVDIKASEGVTSMTLNFSAGESADVLVMSPATHRGSKREVDSFNLDERQTVVIKLASTGSYKGSYQIRLNGAVKSKSDSAAPSSDTDAPSSDTDAPSPPKKESPPIIDLIRRAATEVESVRRFSADCLTKSGTLSFVMPDGTVKEIKLKGVQKVSHKP
jgi:heme-binding NEAT domain protein